MLDVFLLEKTVPQLDIIFVDEAQDLTTKQWKVIEKLSEHCKFRYIAGDDDQAIPQLGHPEALSGRRSSIV